MPPLQRRYLGCGYEPPLTGVRLTMWSPPVPRHDGGVGYRGPEPTVCAGYTTSLPEVIEAAVIRRHWDKGQVVAACGGAMPTEEMLSSILVVDNAFAEVRNWASTPEKDGGGLK